MCKPIALPLLALVLSAACVVPASTATGQAPSARDGHTAPDQRGVLRAHVATLARLAPSADPGVLAMALSAMQCAQAGGIGGDARRLAVIDYSRSSRLPRMWVFDLDSDRLLHEEWVAHGQGSGYGVPDRFSNRHGSHQTSLGLFRTLGTYQGQNGYSLRMEGLEADINDAALPRAIVIHGADYVDPAQARHAGRLGRSWGCPAVRSAVARPLIDTLSDGQFVFAYAPDADWLRASPYAACLSRARGHVATAPAADNPH